MIDLEPFIGKFEWTTFELSNSFGSYTIVLPDIMCTFRFIILCIMIRYFIKSIFSIMSFFR